MTNETENKSCCGGAPVCGDQKPAGGCGCGMKNCGCAKAACGTSKCCGKIMCKVIVIALIAGLGWCAWQGQSKLSAVCGTLAAGQSMPAVAAPSPDMQAQVDALQDKVVENAEAQNTIEGQYIEHMKATQQAIAQAAGCR